MIDTSVIDRLLKCTNTVSKENREALAKLKEDIGNLEKNSNNGLNKIMVTTLTVVVSHRIIKTIRCINWRLDEYTNTIYYTALNGLDYAISNVTGYQVEKKEDLI